MHDRIRSSRTPRTCVHALYIIIFWQTRVVDSIVGISSRLRVREGPEPKTFSRLQLQRRRYGSRAGPRRVRTAGGWYLRRVLSGFRPFRYVRVSRTPRDIMLRERATYVHFVVSTKKSCSFQKYVTRETHKLFILVRCRFVRCFWRVYGVHFKPFDELWK